MDLQQILSSRPQDGRFESAFWEDTRCINDAKSTVLFDYVLYDVCYVFKVLGIYVNV